MPNYQDLLDLILPQEINWNKFDLIKIEEIEDKNISPYKWRLNFVIQEKNIPPVLQTKDENGEINKVSELNNIPIIQSKWFYLPKQLNDFPLRNKLATLTVINRRWIDKNTNKYLKNNNTDIIYNWTKSVFTLLDFLKWDLW